MEVIEDAMDLDVLASAGADLRAAKAAYLAAAAAAAGGGTGRDIHRRPPMPIAIPSKQRVDGGIMPPPSPHSGSTAALSPLSGRMSYEQLNGGMGLLSDRGMALPQDLGALQQALLQNGGLNGHPAVMLRLLMQAHAATAGNGMAACGIAQSNPRSSNGGSGGGSDRANAGGLHSSFPGLPIGGGTAAMPNGRVAQGSAKGVSGGFYGSTPLDCTLHAPRGNSSSSQAEAFASQPATRNGSAGSGASGASMASLDSKGFTAGGMPVNADVLKVLLATNGPSNGLNLGSLGPPNVAVGQMSELLGLSSGQLQILLQQVGLCPGGGNVHGALNGGGGSSALLNGLKCGGSDGMGGVTAGGQLSLQHLATQLALNGVDSGMLAAALGANTGSKSSSGGPASTTLGPIGPHLAALLQQQGIMPDGPLKSPVLNSILGTLSALGSIGPLGGGGGGGGGGRVQLNHLLSGALGGGGRLQVGRMDELDESDVPSTSAAAVAAATAAAREADGNCDSRSGGMGCGSTAGGPGSDRGSSGRPQRHSSSDLGAAVCSGGGNSKGPTGLQLLKNLVTSGAAGAGVAGLMNGSGGLADLSGLPGGVATQLLEDLESLGYRTGISQRVGSGAASGTAGLSSRSGDAGARLGSAAPSNGMKSRFMPPGSPGVKKPNKRPENGSLATQILNRQRHALAMQQASGNDTSNAVGVSSIGLPAGQPLPPSSSLLAAAADQAMLLGHGGAGLGGLVSSGAVSGLAGVLGEVPPGAAATGLPHAATTATLLATQPSVTNNSALPNAVAAARNGGTTAVGLLPGLTTLGGGEAGLGALAPGSLGGTGAAPSAGSGSAAAQFRALTLAGLPNSTAAAALLATSGLRKPHGLGASLLLGQPIPKGRRSRRTARATGTMKMRNIMKDLGILMLKRPSGDALQSERDTRGETAQGSGGAGSGSSGGSSDGGNDASVRLPPTRRQRINGTWGGVTAGSMLHAASATGSEAKTAAVAAASRAGSGVGGGDVQMHGNSPLADNVGGIAKLATGALVSNIPAVAGLPWDLIVRSTAAGVPLAAMVAKVLGLQASEVSSATDGGNPPSGNAGTAAILSAALAARAVAAAAGVGASQPTTTKAPAASTLNGGPPGLPAARPSTAVQAVTSGPAVGSTGKAGQAGKAAAAATTTTTGSGSHAAAAAAAASTKSRRKGGAPSRAAD